MQGPVELAVAAAVEAVAHDLAGGGHKREVELEALQLRPHPYEFFLYYDV